MGAQEPRGRSVRYSTNTCASGSNRIWGCAARRSRWNASSRCSTPRAAASFPTLALDARYSRAEGGREIELPLGTLLNPVYSTLNDLLAAQGQPPAFAPIEDQTIPFLREREQDTRLTLRQPLYAPAIPASISRAALRLLEGLAVRAHGRARAA